MAGVKEKRKRPLPKGLASLCSGLDHNLANCWPKPVASFLEAPEGLDFLHRLYAAAHLVAVQASDCGLRNLGWFLNLSGLDAFIAPSYGGKQAVASNSSHFWSVSARRKTNGLPPRCRPGEITLCEDETLHPQICLVPIEPASNLAL